MTENQADELQTCLTDWKWRFTNLYWIKPADARAECLFIPRPEQWRILELIYEHGNTRLAILKSRQLGFSTLLSLIMLDWLLFRPGVKLGLVEQTSDDAQKKLDKVKFAWKKLPPDLRESYDVVTDNNSEFAIQLRSEEEDSDQVREMYAGKNVRGSTLDFLWISEWGPIQVEDPHRSNRIADGGLPAAEKGLIVIETTWRGGETGRLWEEVVEHALELKPEHRTLRDWFVLFFPWYLDPELRFEGDIDQISAECWTYLQTVEPKAIAEAEKLGFDFHGFDDRQRLWYFKVAWPKRHKRYEEYPTIQSEMFLSPQPGAIFPEEITDLRNSGRLCSIPIIRGRKVIVSFDIGRSDYMPCCFIQWVANEVRVVDYHCSHRETVPYYAKYVRDWCLENGINQVEIVLPHDSRMERIEARESVYEQFAAFGKATRLEWNVITIDACASIWDGIEDVREVFPYIHIDKDRATNNPIKKAKGHDEYPSLVTCLTQYHAKVTPEGQNMVLEPVHDKFSHGCSALRTFCEGFCKGMISPTWHVLRKPKIRTGSGAIDDLNKRGTRRTRIRKPKIRL